MSEQGGSNTSRYIKEADTRRASSWIGNNNPLSPPPPTPARKMHVLFAQIWYVLLDAHACLCLLQHQRIWIKRSLRLANAHHANPSLDHRQEKCICRTVREERDSKIVEKDDDEQEDSKTITESTQVMAVCSTLIATVAFAAAFTLPGGYRADDHTNGGTPTFVGSYGFDAFVLAITFAFVYSLLATFSLVYSGMTKVDYSIRLEHLNSANSLVWLSIRCLLAAFALGLYVVLAPVAHKTALLICLMCSVGLLHGHTSMKTQIRMAVLLQGRIGFKVWWILGRKILRNFLHSFWPFLIIFGWPAYLKWRHQQ